MSTWIEGMVDRDQRHLVLSHEEHASPVAVIGPEVGGAFVVQFLLPRDSSDPATSKVIEDVTRQIDYYLVEKGEPNPWAYAVYHGGTASNFYSRVHWGCIDPHQPERPPRLPDR